MKTFNPKKNKEDRRKRPAKSLSTYKQVFVEYERKSQSGVKYTKIKPVIIKI